jgi:hypothetical protein
MLLSAVLRIKVAVLATCTGIDGRSVPLAKSFIPAQIQ